MRAARSSAYDLSISNTHRRDQVLADEQSREAGERAVTRIQAISRGKRARQKKAKPRGRTRVSDGDAMTDRLHNNLFDREGQPNEDGLRHRDRFDTSDESGHRGPVEGKRAVAPPRDTAAMVAGAVSEGVVIDRRAAKLIASLVDERVMVRSGAWCVAWRETND